MIHDIEAGRVDLVIVKDLSRFGRDCIDTSFCLERSFPTKNVRFIAINDHEAIIFRELWDTVQVQISRNTRGIGFDSNVGLFAGF